MRVKELIELNAMVTDLEITVRKNGGQVLDQLNRGCSQGVKPPYPTRVPRDAKYAGSINQMVDKYYKDAAYIPKSINAWDDGKEHYQIMINRIPAKWIDLEVYSWEVWRASRVCTTSSRRSRASNFYGQLLKVVALPSGEPLETQKQEKTKETKYSKGLDGQICIDEWMAKEDGFYHDKHNTDSAGDPDRPDHTGNA